MPLASIATEKKGGGNGAQPGIQFGQFLSSKGNPILGPDNKPMSLGIACELALDAALRTDENEGLKPKLRRGRLIEEINAATVDMVPLALGSEDITLIKERIAGVFGSSSLVRKICLLLDPGTKE